eukprot:g68589.t1
MCLLLDAGRHQIPVEDALAEGETLTEALLLAVGDLEMLLLLLGDLEMLLLLLREGQGGVEALKSQEPSFGTRSSHRPLCVPKRPQEYTWAWGRKDKRMKRLRSCAWLVQMKCMRASRR